MNPLQVITKAQWLEHIGRVVAVDRKGELGIVASGADYPLAIEDAERFNARRAARNESHVNCTFLAVPHPDTVAEILSQRNELEQGNPEPLNADFRVIV